MLSRRCFTLYPIKSRKFVSTFDSLISAYASEKDDLKRLNDILSYERLTNHNETSFNSDIAIDNLYPAIKLRSDIIKWKRKSDKRDVQLLSSIDNKLSAWLSTIIYSDLLDFQVISYDTSSGAMLEKVTVGDAVHPVKTIVDMKKRFSPSRRCYALVHDYMKNDPLAFIHVAFTSELASSIVDLDDKQQAVDPRCAMFYSINSPHIGLSKYSIIFIPCIHYILLS